MEGQGYRPEPCLLEFHRRVDAPLQQEGYDVTGVGRWELRDEKFGYLTVAISWDTEAAYVVVDERANCTSARDIRDKMLLIKEDIKREFAGVTA